MNPPLVVDIDGTLTRANVTTSPAPIDPRIFDSLASWRSPVIVATGKAFPFAVALSEFIGLERLVIAENGGIACVGNNLSQLGKESAAKAVETAMASRGFYPSDDELGFINRWRETEVAFRRDVPLETLESLARTHDLHVVDTGYAFHVKDPEVTKGRALEWVIEQQKYELDDIVAIGDSVNDVSLFERVGRSYAVSNADDAAKNTADVVTDKGYADGFLEALSDLRESR